MARFVARWTSFPVAVAALALGVIAGPVPLRAQALVCPADAPATDPNASSLLQALTAKINQFWAPAATNKIDPLKFEVDNVEGPCPSDGGTKCFFGAGLTNCLHSTSTWKISNLMGLKQLTFSPLTVIQTNPKDVAAHTGRGPDAGKITDGIFAPEGSSYTDARAVVLPFAGPAYGLTIDLGKVVTLCGNTLCVSGPKIQADSNDQYLLDYSTDGATWKTFGAFTTVGGGGLRTRPINGTPGTTFSARYVRVYADPDIGDGKYSVAELELRNALGVVISRGAQAIGPRPAQIADGVLVSNGTSWNDKRAVVLAKDGPGHALVIDLGTSVSLCGNGYDCKSGPVIQADRNDVYQLDYSSDGVNWTELDQFPTVSGDGLQTRNIGCNLRPDKSTPCSATNHNPNFKARYVRVWAVSGDGKYSVSELQLWNTSSVLVSTGKLTYGPEPLITNGEAAPAGTGWDDSRYARVLTACSPCPIESAKSAAATIDLGQTFPLSALKIQADQSDAYQVDGSTDGTLWTALWTAPPTGGSGLQNRTSPPLSNAQARYLRVYATAGDGKYSVSALEAFTPKANTACLYDQGADAGQNFSCSYDGTLSTQVQPPQGALTVQFTVDSAFAHLRCTNGTSDGSTSNETIVPSGTKCTATLTASSPSHGNFCSGSCAITPPAGALSHVELDNVSFALSGITCDHSIDSDVKNGLLKVTQGGTIEAVQEFFNGLVVSPAAGPMVPTGICEAAVQDLGPDTAFKVQGSVSNIGTGTDNGSIRLSGRFSVTGAIALNELKLTLGRVLEEVAGAQELLASAGSGALLPLQLQPRGGSTATAAIYETPSGARPSIQVEVKTRDVSTGVIEFSLRVDRAMIPRLPAACATGAATVQLTASFALERSGDPVLVHAAPDWRCLGSELRTP